MQGITLIIPDHDPVDPQAYPGNLKPGSYGLNQIVDLLRDHAEEPEVIRFVADMLEE